MMEEIVHVHFPDLEKRLLTEALKAFYWLRGISGLQKKPSTSELLDWVQALTIGGIKPEKIYQEIPFLGALLKKNQDFDLALKQLHLRGTENQSRVKRGW